MVRCIFLLISNFQWNERSEETVKTDILVSCTLAVVAGVCFMSGLVILTD